MPSNFLESCLLQSKGTEIVALTDQRKYKHVHVLERNATSASLKISSQFLGSVDFEEGQCIIYKAGPLEPASFSR